MTQDLEKQGIGLRSLQEQLDTTTPGGKLVFHVFGALAEFERDLVRERTNAGLAAARARGRVGGRKPVLTGKKAEAALALYHSKTVPVSEICKTLGVSRTSLYRLVGEQGVGQRPVPDGDAGDALLLRSGGASCRRSVALPGPPGDYGRPRRAQAASARPAGAFRWRLGCVPRSPGASPGIFRKQVRRGTIRRTGYAGLRHERRCGL